MKKLMIFILIIFSLFSTAIFAMDHSAHIKLVTDLYKEFFEKKNMMLMDEYFSRNVEFYLNFDPAADYNTLQQHLSDFNKQCVTLKMLPFDKIFKSDNKVDSLYSSLC